jgi:hypothetical protein
VVPRRGDGLMQAMSGIAESTVARRGEDMDEGVTAFSSPGSVVGRAAPTRSIEPAFLAGPLPPVVGRAASSVVRQPTGAAVPGRDAAPAGTCS